MDPKEIADLFAKDSDRATAFSYLKSEDVIPLIDNPAHLSGDRIPPNYQDLARLHQTIRMRKAFTILEFGLGYSTIVMADALMKNKLDWEALDEKPKIRNSTPFQLHAVDTSQNWIEQTQSMLPEHLTTLITLHYSSAKVGTFQDRACHFYEELPDIVPDFIYLDGPDPATVIGNIGGTSWQNRDRVVTSGDLLRLEPQLIPGTLIVIDGRTANARFLQAHFYRNWQINHSIASDVTVCELQESPLGQSSRNLQKFIARFR